MKHKLTKPELNFLQKMLNVVYSFNICDKAYLQQLFPNDQQLFEKLYPIMEDAVKDKTNLSKMVPKDKANYNLGQSGISLGYMEYYEAIYLQQLQYADKLQGIIKSPDMVLTAIDTGSADKSDQRYKKLKKIAWGMLATNAILGIWLMIKWS